MKQKYILFTLFALISFKGFSQNNYSVTSIPFQPFTGTLTPVATPDDEYTPVISLPFSFDFYGVSYYQMVIGTNGYIDFRTGLTGLFSPYMVSIPIPSANFAIKNSIMGCFEDLDNSAGAGTLTVGTYGVQPNRKFVVYFNNHSHWNQNPATPAFTSFQIILSETSNSIDVQVMQRQPGSAWGGKGVIGVINLDGTQGLAAPDRNTGNWTASQEAWRFYRPGYYPNYSFVRCDNDNDGFQVFDLSVAANDLSSGNPSSMVFYGSMGDAQAQVNPYVNINAFLNTSNPQTIYASGNNGIKPVVLSVIDCAIDADNDGVPSETEDVNNDTNLANDDTDFDGIPNYRDNDDDGDLVLTNVEYVFAKTNTTVVNALLDTDNDGTPNYLDSDDDGDNVLTFNEDYNHDGNPVNDDTNSSGFPDYLESSVALGIPSNSLSRTIQLYPNPASSELNISNTNGELISNIAIYSINGSLVKEIKANNSSQDISVSELQSGIYFVKITSNDKTSNLKFIKQ